MKQFVVALEMALKSFVREKLSAFMAFVLPVMFVCAYGFSSQASVKPLVLGIEDQDETADSIALVQALLKEQAIQARLLGIRGGVGGIESSDTDGVLYINSGGHGGEGGARLRLVAGEPASHVMRLAIVHAVQAQGSMRDDAEPSIDVEKPAHSPSPFEFVFPGIVALALLQVGLFGTATPLIADRERGVTRLLFLSPGSRTVSFAAELVVRLLLVSAQLVVLLLLARQLFQFSLGGSLPAFVGVALLGGAMLVSLGYLMANLAPSAEAGQSMLLALNFLLLFGGGLFFDPLESKFYPLSRMLPVTYLADALRQISLGAQGMCTLTQDVLVMAAFTVALAAVAMRLRHAREKH
jgi:ABC-2 type transport system permease protein